LRAHEFQIDETWLEHASGSSFLPYDSSRPSLHERRSVSISTDSQTFTSALRRLPVRLQSGGPDPA
jgi:hypothetical protein